MVSRIALASRVTSEFAWSMFDYARATRKVTRATTAERAVGMAGEVASRSAAVRRRATRTAAAKTAAARA
jgi:hypothetical protein